ncbi:hypothetical protein B0H67DRAFT_180021 [Lasiosphaeris hirsuta]|uniref:Uncharacterized protein n=1 Tax=Lasiosphaeris hirsuta TaxID=260670 RepID=A0AA40E0Y0_9PEZI|nr:hypothetical protein B0H67DRAFT_180021 [Lasiosphaeris hirsuta]
MKKLTEVDIQTCITAKLGENREFQALRSLGDNGARGLIEGAIDNAKGVFLWVYSVARLLLEASSNGEPLSELCVLVDSLPPDLTALFDKILLPLQENEKQFRKTSELIQFVRASVKLTRVLELSFAEEADTEFAFGLAVRPPSYTAEEARSEVLRRHVTAYSKVPPRGEKAVPCPHVPAKCRIHSSNGWRPHRGELCGRGLSTPRERFDPNLRLSLAHIARIKTFP